jgi:outer membrane receptor protein involved in Fe transport
MKYFSLVITLFCLTFSIAQRPDNAGPRGGGAGKTGEIFGTVIDSVSSQPMAYVTVMALNPKDSSIVGGAITLDNGSFSISGLKLGAYFLKVSFVGYRTLYIPAIKLDDLNSTANFKEIRLGVEMLDVVEINGDLPDIRYEIDKKIINVEDQINTDGQTAVEILQNIPSISVSADGTVSLRGSTSFTLLINGIPTTMNASDALATIPASTIKDIEIITNPSARYDAEGTSGVINIITKKSKLEGLSCLINLSGGNFGNYAGDIALNVKKNNFIFDLSATSSNRGRPSFTTSERITIYDSLTNTLTSEGENNWVRGSNGFGGGVQWQPNNSHVFALRTDFKWNTMLPYSNFNYERFDDDSLVSSFNNEQQNNIDFFNNTSSLFYQYNIKRNQDHNISVKAIYNTTDVNQFDTTLSYLSDGSIRSGNLYTETGPSASWRYNLDYRLPLKKDRKFEAGLQAQFGTSGDVGKNYVYNTMTGEFDFNPLFSSDVSYVRDVHAAYSMFSGKVKKLGYQLGLRAEYTYRTISTTAATSYATIKRLDWFPSAHFSYSLENNSQFLASYSRRIERPRSYFFEPFITWEDPFNVRTGNPNLLPEYINAFEVSYIKPIKRKGFLSLEAYLRKSNNIINRISTVYEPGILISQPYNIGISTSYGLEASFNYTLQKWWKINVSLNSYLFDLTGSLNEVDYSAQSFNYSGRFTNTFTVKGFMIQTVSAYSSGSVTAQGTSLSSFSQDISVKKSFMNNRISLTIQGRNILGTDRRGSFSYTENVTLNSLSKPLYPQLMFTLAIKLNNYQKVLDRNESIDEF